MDLSPNLALVAALWLPFMVTLLALNALLVRPFREYLDGRHDAIVGARHDAVHLDAEVERETARLEAALTSARQEAARIRGEHRSRAQATERDVLGAARQAAEKAIGVAVQEIQQETAVARASLGDQARALSTDIAARVLGRGASA